MNDYSYKSCQSLMLKKAPSTNNIKPLSRRESFSNSKPSSSNSDIKKSIQGPTTPSSNGGGFFERLIGFPSKMKDFFKNDSPVLTKSQSSNLSRSLTAKEFSTRYSLMSKDQEEFLEGSKKIDLSNDEGENLKQKTEISIRKPSTGSEGNRK
jgi:hypothetical protein